MSLLLTSSFDSKVVQLSYARSLYGAIPHTTETETDTDTDTDTETVMGNRTFNIYVFGLSTRIRSYVRNLQYI